MDIDDVAAMAMALPEVTERLRHGNRTWDIRAKGFAWERPFSKADLKRFAPIPPPGGLIVATRVADLGEKDAVLAAHPDAFFTIPHFDGYPAVLIEIDKVGLEELEEALIDGWLACAPAALAAQHFPPTT